MYDNWAANMTVVLATAAAVALCIIVHYEGLLYTTRDLQRTRGRQRSKLLHAIFSMLGLHIIEIWIFGLIVWGLLHWPACGQLYLLGKLEASPLLLDSIYLSAVTYTTVGFGDIVPVGPVRFVTGTEALTGFLLIGWSASFTYLEMERFWKTS